MTSQARRAGAEFLRTIAQALVPGAEASRALTFGRNVGGTPQLFVRSPDGSRQISGLAQSFWDKPVTAHAYDDEFDSTTLDPAWTQIGSWEPTQGGINPYDTTPGPNNALWDLHTNRRPSWLMIQPRTSPNPSMRKAIAPAGDFFVYARFSVSTRVAAINNNESSCYLMISTDPWDVNNLVYMKIGASGANNMSARFARFAGGVFTSVALTTNEFSTTTGMQPIEAVGITRRGNNFDGWAFAGSGHVIWLGTTALAIAPRMIALEFNSNENMSPGNKIAGCDFFRYRDGSSWIP